MIEVLGAILVPILLFILSGMRKDIRENRKEIRKILKHLRGDKDDKL